MHVAIMTVGMAIGIALVIFFVTLAMQDAD